MTKENVQLLGTNEEGFDLYSEFDSVSYDREVREVDSKVQDIIKNLSDKLNPTINQKAMLETAVRRYNILEAEIKILREVIINLAKHKAFKNTTNFEAIVSPSTIDSELLAPAYPERKKFTTYFAEKDGKRYEVVEEGNYIKIIKD